AGLVEGCDTVVHLASVFGPERRGERAAVDVTLTRRVLDVAAATGASQLVLMSSATIYGAWADNPIPPTEEPRLRRNEGFVVAVEKLEIERAVDELRRERPSMSVAVLRPTVALAEDARSWVSAALTSAAAVRAGDLDPPSQFLHFDDL